MDLLPFLKEKVLYIDDNCILSYHRGKIFFRKDEFHTFIKIGTAYNKFGLLERAMRLEPKCAVKISEDEYIISFNGCIYNYQPYKNKIIVEHKYDKGMKNPTFFTVAQSDHDNSPNIYYGEYIWNTNKGPVSIFKRENRIWKKIYEFAPNSITHIHSIVYDKYRNKFLILTGDEDSESGIWVANGDFSEVKPVVIGKQQYRSCVAFAIRDGIVYATDTPLEQNYIYFMRVNSDYENVEISKEFAIPGPCIYGTTHNDSLYFSTSVEPDSSMNKWRYRFSYKLGKGVKDRNVHVIRRSIKGEYQDVLQLKKDLLPIWIFQFGNVLFPSNFSKKMYLVTQSTKKGHGRTFVLD